MSLGEHRRCASCKVRFPVSELEFVQLKAFCADHVGEGRSNNYSEAARRPLRAPTVAKGGGIKAKRSKRSIPQSVRAEVRERDGGWCRLCVIGESSERETHLHHIVYRSRGGKDVTENLITLCPEHHQLVHAEREVWQELLIWVAKHGYISNIWELKEKREIWN